jgi:hypothetical protein
MKNLPNLVAAAIPAAAQGTRLSQDNRIGRKESGDG